MRGNENEYTMGEGIDMTVYKMLIVVAKGCNVMQLQEAIENAFKDKGVASFELTNTVEIRAELKSK